jgi:hypothetical protein
MCIHIKHRFSLVTPVIISLSFEPPFTIENWLTISSESLSKYSSFLPSPLNSRSTYWPSTYSAVVLVLVLRLAVVVVVVTAKKVPSESRLARSFPRICFRQRCISIRRQRIVSAAARRAPPTPTPTPTPSFERQLPMPMGPRGRWAGRRSSLTTQIPTLRGRQRQRQRQRQVSPPDDNRKWKFVRRGQRSPRRSRRYGCDLV